MKTVFLGTPQFAVPTLQALIDSSCFNVTAVFTQPDRRAGRGKKFRSPPVKILAEEKGIEVFQPERIRGNSQALEIMRRLNPDVAVVVAYGQILPEEFFSVPRLGTVNVHASVLPSYRGASPIVRAVLNGDESTGVTIMKIDQGMDTGDILSIREIPVHPDDTAGEMEDILSGEGAKLLVDTLVSYSRGEIIPVEQDHDKASYAPKLVKADGIINWNNSAQAIHNQIRAMNPRPGAVTSFREEDTNFKIWKSALPEGHVTDGGSPGTLMSWDDEGPLIACGGKTALRILEVQLRGRSRISGRDFINGHGVTSGEILGK